MLGLRLLRGGRGATLERPSRGVDDDLAALLEPCRAGDRRALRTLLHSLGPSMLQVIRRVMGRRHPEIEDALQEATIALLRALPSFRGECSTRHFASRVAAFTAISLRRRRSPSREIAAPDDGDAPAAEPVSPEEVDAALAARRRDLVRDLLDDLPDTQAEALVLHCVVGLTLEELAAASGVPLETARSRLRLAKAALRVRVARDPVALELVEDLA
jgi:RNA polymerase sigma-70 factor (ECF subfamily)